MNKISRQLIRIAISVSKLPEKLKANKEELENFKDSGITIDELREILDISKYTYYENKEDINKFLETIGVKIVNSFVKSLNVNKKQLEENFKDNGITVNELWEFLGVSQPIYSKNKDDINRFLETIGVKIVNSFVKSLNVNKEKLEEFKDSGITINELLEILKISLSTYSKNVETIQEFLKTIGVTIIKEKTPIIKSLNVNKEKLEKFKDSGITINELLEILKKSESAYTKNKEDINGFLETIGVKIVSRLVKSLNVNKKLLEEFKDSGITLSELYKILGISQPTYNNNKETIQEFLNTIGVTIVNGRTPIIKSLNVNKKLLEKFKDSGITINELLEILKISYDSYHNQITIINDFLETIGVKIVSRLVKSLNVNKKMLEEKFKVSGITLSEISEILGINYSLYYDYQQDIQEFLNTIGVTIVKEKTPLEKSLDINKEQLRNKQLTISELLEILKISMSTYQGNKEFIWNFLTEIDSQIIKEKSALQNSFYKQVKILHNVKIIQSEITINCKTEANDTIEKIIKDYEKFQKRQILLPMAKNTKTIIANKTEENNTIYQKHNVLINLLNKYLNDLSRAKIDFYVETFSGKRYLIQCQGRQHYDLQSKLNKNIITRIVIDVAKMLIACKYNCNFIATYDVKAKKEIKSSLDVFNDFYMTTEDAIKLIKTEGTVSKTKIKSCAINMLYKIRNGFEQQLDQLSQMIKEQKKTNREILEQIRQY